jgi:hypothetical protein
MSDELKPCPFCGGTDIENEIDGVWVFTNCATCGGSSFPIDLTKDASNQLREKAGRDTWNTRPIEDRLTAELAAANARIAELECDLEAYTQGPELRDVIPVSAQADWTTETTNSLMEELKAAKNLIGMKDDALNSFAEFYDWCLKTLGFEENDYSTETECEMQQIISNITDGDE